MGRQLEATVHTSLPPRVQGSLRAYVRVCVSAISWEYSVSPPASKLCVGLRWWGEESPGTVFRWGTEGRWTLLQLYIILWIVHTDCMYPYKHTQLSLSLLSHCMYDIMYNHMHTHTHFRVPVVHSARKCPVEESTTLAYFPVRSAMPQLQAYLHGKYIPSTHTIHCTVYVYVCILNVVSRWS